MKAQHSRSRANPQQQCAPDDAKDSIMLVMRAGRISARVLGVFDTIVFQTCSAAERTV